MNVDEIEFQTDESDESQCPSCSFGEVIEQLVDDENSGQGEWNVQHTLDEQWEFAVFHLLQIDTRSQS